MIQRHLLERKHIISTCFSMLMAVFWLKLMGEKVKGFQSYRERVSVSAGFLFHATIL